MNQTRRDGWIAWISLEVFIISCVGGNVDSCPLGTFLCNDTSACVEQKFICDKYADCQDKSDEWNCEDHIMYEFINRMFRKRPDEDREKRLFPCTLSAYPDGCRCSLTEVFCENADLTEVPQDISGNVSELDLSGNKIHQLDVFSFPYLPKLKSLIFITGEVESVGYDTFQNVMKLRTLYLTSNRIIQLENNTFISLRALRLLVLSHNPLSILRSRTFSGLEVLSELDLRRCQLNEIPQGLFDPLRRLKILWLDENFFSWFEIGIFGPLRNLETLSLSRNLFIKVPSLALGLLSNLRSLSLSWNRIIHLEERVFMNLSRLYNLNLRNNRISSLHLKALVELKSLASLNLNNNPLRDLPVGVFESLTSLKYLYLPDFVLCAYAPYVRVCEPKGDGISSLANLLDNYILRISVWVVALAACGGNFFVLVGRLLMKEPNEVHSFYIKNLALADLIMGVYLLVIAIYDCLYRGEYIRHDRMWRHSWTCQISGALSTVSAEASVLIMTVITIDRYISITYPLAFRRRTSKVALSLMATVWLVATFLSFLPLTNSKYFGDEFYGNNAVCLPLHIHDPYGEGWKYSLFVFCGLNSVAFLIIALAYVRMFYTVVRSRLGLRSSQQQQERNIAKRFAFIVGTDFICWCPIIVIKFLSLAGLHIEDNLYAWVAIFLLPVNSALDPVLYTLTTKLFKQQLAKIVFTWKSPNLPPVPPDTSGISLSSIFYVKGSNRLHIVSDNGSNGSGTSLLSANSRIFGLKRNASFSTAYTFQNYSF